MMSSGTVFPYLLFLLTLRGMGTCEAFTGTYGINYGRISDNIPAPEVVVSLLKAVKIKNVKIFDSDHSVLNAFKGSGLELVVGLSNDYVKEVSSSEDKAMEWIKENVQPWLPDTHIRGIAVGNEVLGGADQELEAALFGAIKNVYKALSLLELTDLIQISSPHSQAVFDNSYPPSNCTFRDNIFQYMKPILDFFSEIDSPFSINIYPFIAYKNDPQHIDLNYALFEPNRGINDPTTNLHYDNMFDAVIDAAYAALEAAGYDKTAVEVTETGWASSGDEDETGASNQYAQTYNYNLRKRLFKRKGTPRRPKIVIKAYIFALFNEDLKPGPGSERHYGLFKPDGSISYDVGLSTWHASSSSCSLKEFSSHLWLKSYFMPVVACIWSALLLHNSPTKRTLNVQEEVARLREKTNGGAAAGDRRDDYGGKHCRSEQNYLIKLFHVPHKHWVIVITPLGN